jgi:hypothetical protein
MKTRELLTCDIRVFGAKVDRLKPKDLYQHIGRVAASLGERDPDAMMDRVVQGLFAGGDPPDTSSEEMGRVFDAVGGRIVATSDNMETVLRLVALCLAWLRKSVALEARQRNLVNRRPARHAGDQCHDPDCREHQELSETPVAPVVRSTLH